VTSPCKKQAEDYRPHDVSRWRERDGFRRTRQREGQSTPSVRAAWPTRSKANPESHEEAVFDARKTHAGISMALWELCALDLKTRNF